MNSFDKPKGPSSGAVNKRIGTNADASGNNTLFAWMLRLYNYVGTAISNIATMQGNITTLLTNWTATKAGYLDANVSSVNTNVVNTYNLVNTRVYVPTKPRRVNAPITIAVLNQYYLAASVSGAGMVSRVKMRKYDADVQLQLRVTIDGVVQPNMFASTSTANYGTSGYSQEFDILCRFGTSFTIEILQSTVIGSGAVDVTVDYTLA